MIYGYCRVSSKGQAKDGNSLEAQETALREKGAERIYTDVYTGTTTDRPQLDQLLSEVKPGDKIVVTKLDRIARSVQQGITLIDGLIEKGIAVDVINMGPMDDTPTGKLVRTVMLAFAEFERDMIMQRTREGKEIARRQENFREGRPHKYTTAQLNHAMELMKTHSRKRVSELTGISMSTLAREKRDRRKKQDLAKELFGSLPKETFADQITGILEDLNESVDYKAEVLEEKYGVREQG